MSIIFESSVSLFGLDAYDSPFQVGPVFDFNSRLKLGQFLALLEESNNFGPYPIKHAHVSYEEFDTGVLNANTWVSYTLEFPSNIQLYYYESAFYTKNGERHHYEKRGSNTTNSVVK